MIPLIQKGIGKSRTNTRPAVQYPASSTCPAPANAWWTLVLALFLLAAPTAAALDPQKAITQYRHEVWRVDEGLPQNTIPAVVQTPDGFIWLGTELGLVRFDGLRFTVFDKSNTPELGSNTVLALYADRQGSLWIGTSGGGLTQLKRGRFVTYTNKDGLGNDSVLSITEDRAGVLWVGTNGGGLSRLQNGRFTTYTAAQGLAGNAVLAIAADPEGTLWLGTRNGLSRMRQGRFTTFGPGEGLHGKSIRALYADREGGLWIGMDGEGLTRFKDGRFRPFTTSDGLPADAISSIVQDDAGTLWFGTVGGGLCRWAAGKFTPYSVRDGLSNDDVRSLYADRGGNLWIGTGGGGLNRLMNTRFTAFNSREGLSSDVVLPIFEDSRGRIWMGTNGGGVNRMERGQIIAITTRDGLADNLVFTIAEDRQGAMWFGTRRGLNRLQDGAFTLYTTSNGLPSDIALATLVDRDGRLWIGTRGGLSVYREGQFTNYTTAEGLSANCVQAIAEDHQGSLWIGTCGGGLNRLKDGRVEIFDAKRGLSNNVVMSLHADREGDLWVGTNGGGLNRLKDGRFTVYTTREGLADDAVFQILEDGDGNLWMSSTKGVFRCSKEELRRHTGAGKGRVHSVLYDRADGMKSKECNGGFQPAGWKSRNGTLWFPTMSGAVAVDPTRLQRTEPPPPVIIETAQINQRAADPYGAIQIRPGIGDLEFRYTAISFQYPDKTTFRYKLEGFDPDWIDAGRRREAYYTNIPAGNYRFRVIAATPDGVWNTPGASVNFTLLPHWWEMRWFRALCVSIALGSMIFIVWWKDRIAKTHRRSLEAMVAQRTVELSEQIRRKEQALADLAQAQERLVELSRLSGMAEVASGVLHNVGNVLNSVNVSATVVAEKIGGLRVNHLAAAIELLERHTGSIDSFLRDDPKGQRVLPYLTKLGKNLQDEREVALAELRQLEEHIEHIKAVLSTQQKYARVSSVMESASVVILVEDALRVVRPEFEQHHIRIEREFAELPPVDADRHRILQILVNLLRNAKDAVVQNPDGPRTVGVTVRLVDEAHFRVEVKDSGVGLAREDLTRIFAHGFTTKALGHGFGLHSGALAARQMSGALWAESDGPGFGATFILELPVSRSQHRSAA